MQAIDRSEAIILDHVKYAMAAALVPIPLADVAAVTLVQLDMVQKLAARHDVDVDRPRARALVLALCGASAARLGASVVKAAPGGGWLLGGAAQAGLSGAATWALGQVYRQHFENQGTLDDVDFDALRERYRDYVRRGREIARSLREQVGLDDVEDDGVEALERLARLRAAGVLTEEEYRRLLEPRER